MSATKNVLVIIVLLSFSLCISSILKKTNKVSGLDTNKWFQFAKGVIEELGGGSNFNDCLPTSWVNYSVNSGTKSTLETNFSNLNSNIQNIINLIEKEVDYACNNRSTLK